MRRSILVMAGTALSVLLLAGVFQTLENQTGAVRYHQHLEQPSEEDLGECTVCGGTAELCTHLPIIQIETGGQTIPGRPYEDENGFTAGYYLGDNGEEEIAVHFSTVEDTGKWHHKEDEPNCTGEALFRIRGNSSRWFSKASYRLKLTKEGKPEEKENLPLLGMARGSEWALYGPFLDKTLLRNYMWMNISGEVMGTWTPNVRYCELILDGEYQGVYLLMEKIDVAKERLNLTAFNPNSPVYSYLVRIETHNNPEKVLDTFGHYTYRMEPDSAWLIDKESRGSEVELLYPGVIHQTEQVKEYVQSDYNEIEKYLYSYDIKNDEWKEKIDMESFVDFYILMEFLAVNDTFTHSTYLFKDVRGKLCIGPVWDYNNVLENFLRPVGRKNFLFWQRGWYARLLKDEDFTEAVIVRYRELRKGILSEERLVEYANSVERWLGSAIDRNFEVWGYSFDPNQLTRQERRRPDLGSGTTLEDVNPTSYDEAMEWMLDYMIERGEWLDEHIDSLRQYCHPSKHAGEILG